MSQLYPCKRRWTAQDRIGWRPVRLDTFNAATAADLVVHYVAAITKRWPLGQQTSHDGPAAVTTGNQGGASDGSGRRRDREVDFRGFQQFAGASPQNAHVPSIAMRAGDSQAAQHLQHTRIALVEVECHGLGITIDAKRQLGQVVRTDGKPVEYLGKASTWMTLLGISHIT